MNKWLTILIVLTSTPLWSHDLIQKYIGNSGPGYGFYVSQQGHFITSSYKSQGLTTLKIQQGNQRLAWQMDLKALHDSQGYRIYQLRTGQVHSEQVYRLGDSDTVDIGDTLWIAGQKKEAQIVRRLKKYKQYKAECLIVHFNYTDQDVGRPVLNKIGQVIGMVIKWQAKYLTVPINPLKKSLKEWDFNFGQTQDFEGILNTDTSDYVLLEQMISLHTSEFFGKIEQVKIANNGQNVYIVDSLFGQVKKLQVQFLGNQDAKVVSLESLHPFKKPISLAITPLGMVVVLDEGRQELVLLNADLGLIRKASYKNLKPTWHPKKLEAFGEDIYFLTKSKKLYRLALEKKSGRLKVHPLKIKNPSKKIQGLFEDMVYDKQNQHLYLLEKGLKQTQVLVLNKQKDAAHPPILTIEQSTWDLAPGDELGYNQDLLYLLNRKQEQVTVYKKAAHHTPKKQKWMGKLSISQSYAHTFEVGDSYMVVGYQGESFLRFYDLQGDFLYQLGGSEAKPLAMNYKDNYLSLVYGSFGFKRIPLKAPSETPEDKPTSDEQPIQEYALEDPQVSLRGLEIGTDQYLYVLDTRGRTLMQIEKKQETIKTIFSKQIIGEGSFGEAWQPIALAIHQNQLYVLDKEGQRIFILDTSGVILNYFQVRGLNKEILYPQDLVLDDGGQIHVLAENWILTYNDEGVLQQGFKAKGVGSGYQGYMKGLSYYQGHFYVSDTYNHRIRVYSSYGEYQSSFGGLGGSERQFLNPTDLVIKKGRLYILDQGNSRILVYKIKKQVPEKTQDKPQSATTEEIKNGQESKKKKKRISKL